MSTMQARNHQEKSAHCMKTAQIEVAPSWEQLLMPVVVALLSAAVGLIVLLDGGLIMGGHKNQQSPPKQQTSEKCTVKSHTQVVVRASKCIEIAGYRQYFYNRLQSAMLTILSVLVCTSIVCTASLSGKTAKMKMQSYVQWTFPTAAIQVPPKRPPSAYPSLIAVVGPASPRAHAAARPAPSSPPRRQLRCCCPHCHPQRPPTSRWQLLRCH